MILTFVILIFSTVPTFAITPDAACIFDEVHKDRIMTEGTGGAHRAKWNICPNSTKNWKAIMSTGEDALIYGAKVIAYAPDIDYDPHPVSDYKSPQISAWAERECQ